MNDFDTREALAARLRRGGPVYDDEWEFLAECVERAPPLASHELKRARDEGAAETVIIMQVVAGWSKEAAVAHAMAQFGMARSAVFDAVNKHSEQCAGLRRTLEDALNKSALARSIAAVADGAESKINL